MKPALSELKPFAGEYPLVSVYRTIGAEGRSPVDALRMLKRVTHKLFVLEHTHNDADGSVVWDRYAYIGFAPSLQVSCVDQTVTVTTAQTSFSIPCARPADFLRAVVSQNTAPRLEGLPPFFGGFAGYFSYEYIRLTEPACHIAAENAEGFRDFDLMLLDRLYVFDRQEDRIYLICSIATDRLEENYREAERTLAYMESLLSPGKSAESDAAGRLRFTGAFRDIYPKDAYLGMVEQAKRLIQKGDVAQIVLTNGKRVKAQGSLIDTYGILRRSDPTRYLCYFSSDDAEAVMASPEPIAKLQDGVVMTERLAGSYARGKTQGEDAAQAAALRADEKAINEHNMLVDDARNEFGYLSKIGSVKVEGYLNIIRCARVMHLGSTVTGELKEGMGALDVVNAITPSGAVSGAPKIRSCEVICEIEQERRGIYGATFGYIGLDGNADFFVFIHSAFKKNGEITVRAGGGIVIDSVPQEEYEECLFKAEAMLEAIQSATGGEANDSADR